ncbi:hypothetical protein H257_03266 [Aphanomyces astaci]|uniref:DUF659 domain-containing protein n=1 Tax=Aphanomyces astaci TaxID=112090 RepID=W4H349_APHAT|nr:hypothetical protein H257_03266 [Aphanomyces astaci]ETV85558.1 hypothetical protein H257_03266 [Aphanomyces astaci]|eukprot:XP_009825576.1 hypothetical protein H257_03266 [Aphanomyces astaci]
MWQVGADRKKKSEAKLVVGFMKLFLHDGLELDLIAPSYHGDVLRFGSLAEQHVLSFVHDIAPNIRSSGSVLYVLREQHRIGALNIIIGLFNAKVAQGGIKDPTPIQNVATIATNLHAWVQWIVERNQPFSEVENPLTRNISRLTPIRVKALKAAMDKVTRNVEAKIAAELPDVFGICSDGWTDGSKHFCAIFATYGVANVRHTPLLAMSPLLKPDSMDTDAYIAFIEETLGLYGKELANLAFVTGDNCFTNVSMAAKTGAPRMPSWSSNLALKAFLVPYESDMVFIRAVMKRLGDFAQLENLRATVSGVRDLLLLSGQNTPVKKLFDVPEQFESVTKQLQAEDLDMADARTMFHGLPAAPNVAISGSER